MSVNASGKHAKTRGRSIVYPLSFEWNILSELTEEAAYSRCQAAHLRWGEKSAMNDGFVSISKNRHNSALISSAVFQRAVKTLHVKKSQLHTNTHTHTARTFFRICISMSVRCRLSQAVRPSVIWNNYSIGYVEREREGNDAGKCSRKEYSRKTNKSTSYQPLFLL